MLAGDLKDTILVGEVNSHNDTHSRNESNQESEIWEKNQVTRLAMKGCFWDSRHVYLLFFVGGFNFYITKI